MPEFHLGDPVVSNSGRRFIITGISKSPSGLLYCGESMGWTDEELLDYDYTEQQRAVIEELERTLWDIRKSGEDLEKMLTKVRNEFGGELPPSVKHELNVVRKIVGDPVSKMPGALERSDIFKLCGCTKQLMGEAREALSWVSEGDVRARLGTALRNTQEQLKNVESFL